MPSAWFDVPDASSGIAGAFGATWLTEAGRSPYFGPTRVGGRRVLVETILCVHQAPLLKKVNPDAIRRGCLFCHAFPLSARLTCKVKAAQCGPSAPAAVHTTPIAAWAPPDFTSLASRAGFA